MITILHLVAGASDRHDCNLLALDRFRGTLLMAGSSRSPRLAHQIAISRPISTTCCSGRRK